MVSSSGVEMKFGGQLVGVIPLPYEERKKIS
jgi:hypothetical protein